MLGSGQLYFISSAYILVVHIFTHYRFF